MPPRTFRTGVTISQPGKAEGSYIIHDGGDVVSVLIDMAGNEINVWGHCGHPSRVIDPAINGGQRGHIFGQKEPNRFANEVVLELDWDSNPVWKWGANAPGGKARQHHDMSRLANGNILILSLADRPVADLGGKSFDNDAIYEVNPAGEVVWEWYSGDHLAELSFEGDHLAALTNAAMKGGRGAGALVGFNSMTTLGANKWHAAGDENFHPDNIMVGSRGQGFVAIISRASGDVVWRLGPDHPAVHDMTKRSFSGDLPRDVDCLGGQHDAHIIAEGRPGAGNLLLFDNQGSTGTPPSYMPVFMGSRVLEIDPSTKQIVWQYDGSSSGRMIWSFFSSFLSSAQRLPGGNTLICEGMHGRIFQVTPAGEIVWEFVNPRMRDRGNMPGNSGGNAEHILNNQIYRALPVPYDWVPEGTPQAAAPEIPEVAPGWV